MTLARPRSRTIASLAAILTTVLPAVAAVTATPAGAATLETTSAAAITDITSTDIRPGGSITITATGIATHVNVVDRDGSGTFTRLSDTQILWTDDPGSYGRRTLKLTGDDGTTQVPIKIGVWMRPEMPLLTSVATIPGKQVTLGVMPGPSSFPQNVTAFRLTCGGKSATTDVAAPTLTLSLPYGEYSCALVALDPAGPGKSTKFEMPLLPATPVAGYSAMNRSVTFSLGRSPAGTHRVVRYTKNTARYPSTATSGTKLYSGTDRKITRRLKPGAYRFTVFAVANNGAASKPPVAKLDPLRIR